MKEKLFVILGPIQADRLKCPPLSAAAPSPSRTCRRFDSKVWLATEIGATIPNDAKFDETTKLPRCIDETAVFVRDLLKGRARG
ncbi:hypothetical protein ACVWYQ_003558 [Bradyrhizobium sp. USDA 3397]